jgi:hypothetical protein
MKVFDYIFYRVADFYIKMFNAKNGEALGALLVTLMQGFHIVSILLIIAFFSNDVNAIFEANEGKNFMHSYASLLAIALLAFNFYRYFSVTNYDIVRKKWGFEDIMSRNLKGLYIVVYMVLNMFITIGLSIYRKYYF